MADQPLDAVEAARGRGRRLVLVRHGRTSWNAEGRAQGHTDIGLDDTGRREAEAAAPALADLDPALLVSSDLARARETAAFVEKVTGLTAREDPRLREYDVGARTGLTLEEFGRQVGAQLSHWWDVHQHFDVEGAETSEDVARRVGPALEAVLDGLGENETAVVVMHGACLKVGIATLLGWPLEVAGTLGSMTNCHWAVLAEDGAGPLRLTSYDVGG